MPRSPNGPVGRGADGFAIVWAVVAMVLSLIPASLVFSVFAAATALLAAPYLFPTVQPIVSGPAPKSDKLMLRMLAGALLTFVVTLLASTVGERWSGLLAVFPVLGSVMAVFSHKPEARRSPRHYCERRPPACICSRRFVWCCR